jgi:hypothetical protein
MIEISDVLPKIWLVITSRVLHNHTIRGVRFFATEAQALEYKLTCSGEVLCTLQYHLDNSVDFLPISHRLLSDASLEIWLMVTTPMFGETTKGDIFFPSEAQAKEYQTFVSDNGGTVLSISRYVLDVQDRHELEWTARN